MRPRISVSITCYNHARFIRQCLDSVLAQSYPAADIHVIDDCSTDGSVDILRSYGDRIRLTERTKNLGVAGYTGTINQEIDAAPGEFWYRLDSDDFLGPDYFAAMMKALDREPDLDWICGGLNVVTADGVVTDQWNYTSWPTDRASALKRAWQTASVALPHNGLFRLEFLRTHQLHWNCFPYGWGTDVLFTIRALQTGVRARLIDGYHFNWRTHGNNASCDIDRRVGLVLAVKEYFADQIEPELYLNLPTHERLPGDQRQSLIRLLQAEDLLTAKRKFQIPGMFASLDNAGKIHAALPQFDTRIAAWLDEAKSASGEFVREHRRLTKSFLASQHWITGEQALDHEDFASAIRCADDALTLDPHFQEAQRVRTDALVAQHHPDAGESVAALVTASPGDQRVLNTASVYLAKIGDWEQAFQISMKAARSGAALETRWNLLEILPEVAHRRHLQSDESALVIHAAQSLAGRCGSSERSLLVREQRSLREDCLARYHHRYRDEQIRLLLHLPPNGALKYLFQSWADMLDHMGIAVRLLPWGTSLEAAFEQFSPTAFVSVADPAFVAELNLHELKRYRRTRGLLTGWVTTLTHRYEPCDFNITFHLDPFRDPSFRKLDRPLIPLPFAANPLRHVAHELPVLWDYFFVGTNSPNKRTETAAYLQPVIQSYRGVLAGVGWGNGLGELSVEDAALLYQCAKVLPNFHMQGQLDRFNELNERCYIIPALGCFQIVDAASALTELFAPGELAIADSPAAYERLFDHYVCRPEERIAMTRLAMRRVWENYTLGEVLDRFIRFLTSMQKNAPLAEPVAGHRR